eukprot:scaffold1239_cov175-Pinguiococcus_pyrenoidosus.AAC.19
MLTSACAARVATAVRPGGRTSRPFCPGPPCSPMTPGTRRGSRRPLETCRIGGDFQANEMGWTTRRVPRAPIKAS